MVSSTSVPSFLISSVDRCQDLLLFAQKKRRKRHTVYHFLEGRDVFHRGIWYVQLEMLVQLKQKRVITRKSGAKCSLSLAMAVLLFNVYTLSESGMSTALSRHDIYSLRRGVKSFGRL